MRSRNLSVGFMAVALVTLTVFFSAARAIAQQEKILHSFNTNTADGINPRGNLIFDSSGNLYGTTVAGGAYGYGTVFELTPKPGGGWAERVLHNFGSGSDGMTPEAGLTLDASGNLYGVASAGGTHYGGMVFELVRAARWTEKVLHQFGAGIQDGISPIGGLIFDAAGNLYGTTFKGGSKGTGTAFELSPVAGGSWKENVLHSFGSVANDGLYPPAGLILDAFGNLYGTTWEGGANYSFGTVFELTLSSGGMWTETILHNFNHDGIDAYYPFAGLVFDTFGDLYGTSAAGGANGGGAVFELMPAVGGAWTETVLHSFVISGVDGQEPSTSLILDDAGNIYGTTIAGSTFDAGIAFELTPGTGGKWSETILYNFDPGNGKDGYEPYSALVFDARGNLYGTTYQGGSYGGGTLFEITH